MVRKNKWKPELKLGIWTEKDGFFFVSESTLTAAILNSGKTDEELNHDLGHGKIFLNNLLKGEGLKKENAWFVEGALFPKSNLPVKCSVPMDTAYKPPGHEVKKIFSNLKMDANRILYEVRSSERRDGAIGFHLHGVLISLEILINEVEKHPRHRNYEEIRTQWIKVLSDGLKYKIFKRYKGNAEAKDKLLRFLNGDD